VKTLRLARAAVRAEGLRLHRAARRTTIRIVFLIIALGFLSLAVVFGHLAIWLALLPIYGMARTASGLAGADLVLAIVLGLLAAHSTPGRIEAEAQRIREQAWLGVRRSVDFWAILVSTARLLGAWRSSRNVRPR
jgi:hypothetical protein